MNEDAAVARIRDSLGRLDVRGLLACWRVLQRGGLPGRSLPDGSPSAVRPLPLPDAVDRRLWADRRRLGVLLASADDALASAVRLQNSWLVAAPAVREEGPRVCSNESCGGELKVSERTCGRCRQWRHRYGLEYPKIPKESPV